jgi:predicted RNA methylase
MTARFVVFAGLLAAGCSRVEAPSQAVPARKGPGEPDVVFVTTHEKVVDKMLELAEIRPDDVVYDLGCGDGRIVVAAAKKHGVKAVGIEIDPKVAEQARDNVRKEGVGHLVSIVEGDIFETDFRDATVVMLYLLPELNVKLMPQLSRLRPGSRIVSHSFDMKGARPERVEKVLGKKVYLWRVPWRSE